jgi:hypothetical protein
MSDHPGSKPGFHDEFSELHHDPLIRALHVVIRLCVKVMALLMVLVILWGVADVAYVFYNSLVAPPFMLLNVSNIFHIFGAFMVVLIAIASVVLALGVTYWLIGQAGQMLTEPFAKNTTLEAP